MHDLAFIVAGFLVGAVIGLTGFSGGSLMTSILTFIFGVKPHLAVGTDLLFAGFTKPEGTVRLARAGLVNWRLVAHLSVSSIIGSLVTLTLVGAGVIGVIGVMVLILLVVLYPLVPLTRIVAADIACTVPLMLVAGMGPASLGSVDWSLLAKLLIGSLPGIWLGSRLMQHTPERVVRSMLSMLLAYAGIKLMRCNTPAHRTPT